MLETRNISKRYGAVVANDHLTIACRPGEVLGLLGENGAGKSTLLGILSGLTTPDAGQLVIDGVEVCLRSPGDALRNGIGTVYQHFSLVPTLTVREQLQLAGWRSPSLPSLLREGLTGHERIGTLALGTQQRVEIAKAMIASPRLLLLDEPTSILAPSEIDQLFDLLREIRAQGTSIVLVTHKLREALDLADRIVVLRHGRVAGCAERTDAGWEADTERRLLAQMFGHAHDHDHVPDPAVGRAGDAAPPAPDVTLGGAGEGPGITPEPARSPLLSVRRLSSRAGRGEWTVRDVSLDIRAGETCAIVGIDGQGQRELADVLTGHRRAEGTILFGDRSLAGAPARAFRQAGIGYLTDDRQGDGGLAGMSIALNLILKRQREPRFSRLGILRRRAIADDARHQMETWSIVPARMETPLGLLSGGNIQKVLLAREMAMSPAMLVANKPTHGLDTRTQEIVWRAMRQITAQGGGVLFFTTDLDEALGRADRVAVMSAGRVSSLVPCASTDRRTLATLIVTGW